MSVPFEVIHNFVFSSKETSTLVWHILHSHIKDAQSFQKALIKPSQQFLNQIG